MQPGWRVTVQDKYTACENLPPSWQVSPYACNSMGAILWVSETQAIGVLLQCALIVGCCDKAWQPGHIAALVCSLTGHCVLLLEHLFLKLSISVKHGRGWAVLLKGRLLLSWTEACWPSLTRKADTVQRAAGNGCRRLLAASQWSADTSILHKWQKEEPSKKGLIHFLRKICTVGKHKLFSL